MIGTQYQLADPYQVLRQGHPAQAYQSPTPPATNNQARNRRPRREFTPLSEPLSQIFQKLVDLKIMEPVPQKPVSNPPPSWFKANETCAYHSNAPGHATDKCLILKHRIQDMINRGEILVQSEPAPNVHQNPLPRHEGAGINMITMDEEDGDPTRFIL